MASISFLYPSKIHRSPSSSPPLLQFSPMPGTTRYQPSVSPVSPVSPPSPLSSYLRQSSPHHFSYSRNSPPLAHHVFQQQYQHQQQAQPFFSPVNKISVISLERRIDYHLQRIMKQNRLVNFKNSIEALPIEDRISESLLEIIASSHNLIQRRQNLIQSGDLLLSQLQSVYKSGQYEQAFALLVTSFASLKQICSSLGQLIWALNSNKEHVKYVIKVFALPEVYARAGPDVESIPLKERIVHMISHCEDTIEHCQSLKSALHEAIIPIFLAGYQR